MSGPEPVTSIKLEDSDVTVDVAKLNGGSALLTGTRSFDKLWARIFATQSPSELSEDMTANFNNLGLILALLLTMSLPGALVKVRWVHEWYS